MKLFLQRTFCFLLISLALSCSQKPARIIDNKSKVYQKSRSKYYNNSDSESNSSLNHNISDKKNTTSSNQVEVGSGETLYSLSRKTGVTVSDLIRYNNLTPPYILKSGSIVKIPTPNYHEVKTGETLYAISRNYQMKIDQIVELNNLKPPYSVKVGDKIRVSNLTSSSAENIPSSPTVSQENEEQKPSLLEKITNKSNRFSWPLKGEIISKFGPKSGGLYNDGINIKAKQGTSVLASEDGVVAYVGNELKGYGNLVIVKHSGGWITAYAHLEKTLVKRGDKVAKGQKIALVGSSGNVTSPQLYFGLRKGRDAVNPQNYLQ